MTRIIRLNDGTELPITMCGASGGILWVRVKTTISLACRAFEDPEKTRRMVDTFDEDASRQEIYEGYTGLIHLSEYPDDETTQVGLRLEARE